MKKIWLLCLMTLLAVSSASAYSLVPDNDPYFNPAFVSPNNPTTEGAWLDNLLGVHVDYITRDNVDTLGDEYTGPWEYAIFKFGKNQQVGTLDHYAVAFLGSDSLADILPSIGLSHTTYFGSTPVPEPATMLLLGLGLIGLAASGRKKLN